MAKNNVKVNSWMANFMKSTGRMAKSQFGDWSPNIAGTLTNFKSNVDDFKEYLSSQDDGGFRKEVEINKNFAKEYVRNIVRDLKSGNWYDESRIDVSDEFDDEDFSFDSDFDFESSSDKYDEDDFNIEINPNITINSNITGNNPMVKALKEQSKMIAKNTKASAKQSAYIAEANFSLLNKIGSDINEKLNNISTGINSLVEFNKSVTSDYYTKSLEYQKTMIEGMGHMFKAYTISQEKERDTSHLNLLSGPFNFSEYAKLIKKNISNQIDNDFALTSFKEFWKDNMGKKAMIANPLQFMVKGIIYVMVPQILVNSLKELDDSFGAFVPAMFAKLNRLKGGPLEILSNIFGMKSAYQTSANLGNYNKGPVPFDGKVHKAITEVIPTQLAQIISILSKKDDVFLYDYGSGRFVSSNSQLADYKNRTRDGNLSGYAMSDIKSNMRKIGHRDPEKQRQLEQAIEDYFINVTRSNSSPRFEKYSRRGNVIDEFSDAIRKVYPEANDTDVAIMRQAILSLPRSTRIRLAGGSFESRENVSRLHESIERNDEYAALRSSMSMADMRAYLNAKEGSTNTSRYRYMTDEEFKSARDKYGKGGAYYLDYGESLTESQISQIMKEVGSERSNATGKDYKDMNIFEKLHYSIKSIYNIPVKGISRIIDAANMGLYKIVFGSSYREGDENKGFIEGLGDRLTEGFSRFESYFEENIAKPLKEIFAKWKEDFLNSSLYNKAIIPSKNFLFGREDSEGNLVEKGLFGGAYAEFKNIGKGFARLFTGKGYKDSVTGKTIADLGQGESIFDMFWGNIKTFGSYISEHFFGRDPNKPVKDGEGFLPSLGSSIKDGFQGFLDAIFGPKEFSGGRRNKHYVAFDEMVQATKERAPKAIAQGMTWGLGGLLFGGKLGLLGSVLMPGGPIGGAIVGTAVGFMSQSERFKDWLFGKEEDGQRVGGIISGKVANTMIKHKNAMIGGATVGAIGSLIKGQLLNSIFGSFITGIAGTALTAKLGFLPALIGGPVGGAAIGLGLALLKNSESFRNWLFGEDGVTTKLGDVKNKISEFLSSDNFKKKFGFAAAGIALGAGGGFALGGMGLLGGMSTSIMLGSILGAATGLGAASERWSKFLFGEIIETDSGVYKEVGMFGKMGNFFRWEIFEPMRNKFLDYADNFRIWFNEDIIGNIQDSIQPLWAELKYFGKTFMLSIKNTGKFLFGGIVNNLNRLFTEGLIEPLRDNLVLPMGRFISNTVDKIGQNLANTITLPFKMLGSYAKSLLFKQMGRGVNDLRKQIIKNMATAYLDSDIHKELVKPIVDVAKWTGNAILTEVRGLFGMIGKAVLFTAKLPFKIAGFSMRAMGGLLGLPFKLLRDGKNAFDDFRLSNIFEGISNRKSDGGYSDIMSGNRGFWGSLGDLAATFVPSDLRRTAQSEGAPYLGSWLGNREDRKNRIDQMKSEAQINKERRDAALREKQEMMRSMGYGSTLLLSTGSEDDGPMDKGKVMKLMKGRYGKLWKHMTPFEQDSAILDRMVADSAAATERNTGETNNLLKTIIDKMRGNNDNLPKTMDTPEEPSMGKGRRFKRRRYRDIPGMSTDAQEAQQDLLREQMENEETYDSTYENLKAEAEEEKAEYERNSIWASIRDSLRIQNVQTAAHYKQWDGIFGKNGLLLAGLSLFIPGVGKKIKEVVVDHVLPVLGDLWSKFGEWFKTDGWPFIRDTMFPILIQNLKDLFFSPSEKKDPKKDPEATGVKNDWWSKLKRAFGFDIDPGQKIKNEMYYGDDMTDTLSTLPSMVNNVIRGGIFKNVARVFNVGKSVYGGGSKLLDIASRTPVLGKFLKPANAINKLGRRTIGKISSATGISDAVDPAIMDRVTTNLVTKIDNLLSSFVKEISGRLDGDSTYGPMWLKYKPKLIEVFKKIASNKVVRKIIETTGVDRILQSSTGAISGNAKQLMNTVGRGAGLDVAESTPIPFVAIAGYAVSTGLGLYEGNRMAPYLFGVSPENSNPLMTIISQAMYVALNVSKGGWLVELGLSVVESLSDIINPIADILKEFLPDWLNFLRRYNLIQLPSILTYLLVTYATDLVMGTDFNKSYVQSLDQMKSDYDRNYTKSAKEEISFSQFSKKVGTNSGIYNPSKIERDLTEYLKTGDSSKLPSSIPYLDKSIYNNSLVDNIDNLIRQVVSKNPSLVGKYKLNDDRKKDAQKSVEEKISKYGDYEVEMNKRRESRKTNPFAGLMNADLLDIADTISVIMQSDDKWETAKYAASNMWKESMTPEKIGKTIANPLRIKMIDDALDLTVSALIEERIISELDPKHTGSFSHYIKRVGRKSSSAIYDMANRILKFDKRALYERDSEVYNELYDRIHNEYNYGFDPGGGPVGDLSTKVYDKRSYMTKLAKASGIVQKKSGASGVVSRSGGSYSDTGTTPRGATVFNFKVSSPYGEIRGNDIHEGIDLTGPRDSKIFAFVGGKVIRVNGKYKPNSGYYGSTDGNGFGNNVVIQDANGVYHTYAHLNAVNPRLKVGDTIDQNTLLGVMGHTGSSTGVHLHYQVADRMEKRGRQSYDPVKYIEKGIKTGLVKKGELSSLARESNATIDGSLESTTNFFSGFVDALNKDLGNIMNIFKPVTSTISGNSDSSSSSSTMMSPVTLGDATTQLYEIANGFKGDPNPNSTTNLNGGGITDIFTKSFGPNSSMANSEFYKKNSWFDKDLTTWSGISAASLDDWIAKRAPKNSPFIGNGQVFIDAANESGLDPRYLLAHAIEESGWGRSSISQKKGNYFGIDVFGNRTGMTMGNNLKTGITAGAKWIRDNYAARGQNTLWKMHSGVEGHSFNPGNWWINHIAGMLDSFPIGGEVGSIPKDGPVSLISALSSEKLSAVMKERLDKIVAILSTISDSATATTENTKTIAELMKIVQKDTQTAKNNKPVSPAKQSGPALTNEERLRQYDMVMQLAKVF